jgi:transglutaminase-like putative cysteine protease
MRDANWDDIFQKRQEDATPHDGRLSDTWPWEDWLTFVLTALVSLSVVASIDGARWVTDMPALYPVCLLSLVTAYLLSRVRRNALLLHPLALLAGATCVYLQLLAILPGGTPVARTDNMLDRMHAWWYAATRNGISSDSLPFIILVLVMVWLGTYLSAWAVFRWRNAWLALTPGGVALMWNISFIPGQFSYAFVVFVFSAVLLMMRLNLAQRERDWDERGVAYPEFITLSALNFTFWVTVAILLLAWWLPVADRSDTAAARWNDFTSPITRRFEPLARVFISVNAKKPITIHNLPDALAFQGKITLTGKQAVEVNVELTSEMAAFLRAQSFDEYTAEGWKVTVHSDVPLSPGERTGAEDQATVEGARKEMTINVKVQGGNNGVLFSLGQPLASDKPSDARTGAAPEDITGLRPDTHLRNGDTYAVTGSVAVPSIDELNAAGEDYPQWVRAAYLQMPDSLPERVRRKAHEVTRGTSTPYEAAAAIERYVRTFPVDYGVPAAPPGRDAVDYFLFDAQRGYFDYHASAMALMLRQLGVPARVASGYAVDPATRQGDGNTFGLTEFNAFAWPEVYFPGIGWVEFSPTPSQPLINRPGTAPPEGTGSGSTRVPGDAGDGGIDLGIKPPPQDQPSSAPAASGGGVSLWPALLALAIAGGAVALGAAGGRLAWERGMGGLSKPARLWEKTLRLAALARAKAQPSETPREFAARLERSVPDAEGATYIAASYERARFGGKTVSEDESERLDAAYASVRGSLLRRMLRLKPRSGDD